MEKLTAYVFTTKDIINNKTPILRVLYDDEGDWQFLNNEMELMEDDAMLVSLNEILQIDNSLSKLISQLHKGEIAYRKDSDSPWILKSFT